MQSLLDLNSVFTLEWLPVQPHAVSSLAFPASGLAGYGVVFLSKFIYLSQDVVL